jgi:hypothetical protein
MLHEVRVAHPRYSADVLSNETSALKSIHQQSKAALGMLMIRTFSTPLLKEVSVTTENPKVAQMS